MLPGSNKNDGYPIKGGRMPPFLLHMPGWFLSSGLESVLLRIVLITPYDDKKAATGVTAFFHLLTEKIYYVLLSIFRL